MRLRAQLAALGMSAFAGAGLAQTPPPIGMVGGPPLRGRPPPEGPLPRSVPADLALEMSKAAIASCKGFAVGVSILDASGLPKLYYIPDGTGGNHAFVAARKANTALLVGGPSEDIVERVKTDKALSDKVTGNPAYIAFAGGLPIKAGAQIIGAIGVSGAEPSAKDRACAEDALAKVQSRLR